MTAKWIALIWRLPSGSSTPRVTIWRALKRLGAASLTPGAALLPFSEDLLEQLGWIAQEIDEMRGDAWILPVTAVSEAEEAAVHAQVNAELNAEYLELAKEASRLAAATARDEIRRREIGALRRRLQRITNRDHYHATGRDKASRAVEDCLASIALRRPDRTASVATH